MGCLPYDITIKFYSWLVVIIYVVIIGVLFLNKMRNASDAVKSQKVMYRSIALFFFFYTGVRILFLFSDFERDANCQTLLYFQFVFLGYICSILAFVNLMYFGEKYVIRMERHYVSIMVIIAVIIDAIIVLSLPILVDLYAQSAFGSGYSPAEYEQSVLLLTGVVRIFNYVIQYTCIGIVLMLYIYLIMKSTGKVRRNSIITLLGLAIASAAALLETDALLSSGAIPPWLSPALFAVGISVFAFSYLKTI